MARRSYRRGARPAFRRRSYYRRRAGGHKFLNTNVHDTDTTCLNMDSYVLNLSPSADNYNALSMKLLGVMKWTKVDSSSQLYGGVANIMFVYSRHNQVKADAFDSHGMLKPEFRREYKVLKRVRYTSYGNPNTSVDMFQKLNGIRCNRLTGVLAIVTKVSGATSGNPGLWGTCRLSYAM